MSTVHLRVSSAKYTPLTSNNNDIRLVPLAVCRLDSLRLLRARLFLNDHTSKLSFLRPQNKLHSLLLTQVSSPDTRLVRVGDPC